MAMRVLVFALVLVSAAALPSKKGGCAAPTTTPKPTPKPCIANHGTTVDCSKAGSNLELEQRQTGLYYFNNSVVTWTEAYEFCKTNNMHLANVYNQTIYDDLWLSSDGSNDHYHYWVGGSDINFDSTDVRWTDGTPVNQSLCTCDHKRRAKVPFAMAKLVLIFALVVVSVAALPSKKGGCAAPTTTPKSTTTKPATITTSLATTTTPKPLTCTTINGETFECSKSGVNLDLEQRETGVYYFYRGDKTWFEADEFCKENNMHLANVYNMTIYEDLMKNVNGSFNYHYWVGGSDNNFDKGDVRWTDGTPVDPEMWINQPNPSSDNCAMFCFPLDPIPCNWLHSLAIANYGFICQVPQCCLS
ncbi:macrophage mannose receptor 1-like [Neocloeon triangulifer]|uniref:macrophage mannose receptor 1-like n=1 Tax=Neocloeon triangulifer TaxID=2078957 RepID=UPI00286F9846|nr:macrophage mannose receptor 1-like [Neocloeon triangulifer]